MKTMAIAIDPKAGMPTGGTTKSNGQKTSNAFDLLLHQINQKKLSLEKNPRNVELGQVANNLDQIKAYTSPNNTPIREFERSLRETDRPLKDFKIPAAQREELKEVLMHSGYSEEDASELIKRSSEEDGSINLGTMFDLMPQYSADNGPVFLMDAQDKPLLVQVLKDLGLTDSAIKEYVDALPQKGGKIVVSGLGPLLSQSTGGTVDTSVLSSLLQKLGLDSKEVQALLAQSGANSGQIDGKTFLNMLETAAKKADKGMLASLKNLANKMMVAGNQQTAINDATRIKNQVVQSLEMNSQGLAQTESEEPTSLLHGFKSANQAHEAKNISAIAQNGGTSGKESADISSSAAALKAQTGSQNKAKVSAGEAKVDPTSKESQIEIPTTKVAAAGPGSAAQDKLAQAGAALRSQKALPGYVVRQVSDQMAQMVKRQQTNLQLSLKPAHLGQLNLELSAKNGIIKATIMAESVAAKNALDSGLDQLKNMLGQQGLKLERLEVMVNPDAQQQQKQAMFGNGANKDSFTNSQNQNEGFESAKNSESDDDMPIKTVTPQYWGTNGISLFA